MHKVARFGPGPDGRRPYRFSRDEYLRMADLGLFAGKRVELIGGEVVEMPPQHNRHAQGVQALVDAFRAGFGPGFWVRCQMTLDLSPHGMPEPDAAVVPGGWRTHDPDGIPTAAVLVAESADTTLRDDQTVMMSLYAAARLQEYWVLNLPDRRLEVYRDPTPDPTQPSGARYATITHHHPGEVVRPLAAPNPAVAVADLLV